MHADGAPMLPGYTHILQQQQHQMGLIAEHQESHRRLLAHLEFQQAQEALARARQMEDNRRLVEEAVSKNKDSADTLNQTIRALIEHQRRPNPDFDAALRDFASTILQGNQAIGQAIHSSLEAHAHRVLAHIDAANTQRPTLEHVAHQNHVIQKILEEDRIRRGVRSMSPEEVSGGQPPPPPPPAGGRVPRSRSREARPLTRSDLEQSMRLSAAALRAHDFRSSAPTLRYSPSALAPTVAQSEHQSRAVSVASSAPSAKSVPAAPAVSHKTRAKALLAKPPSERAKATVRRYSIATSEGSQEQSKKVAVRQPRVVTLPIAA